MVSLTLLMPSIHTPKSTRELPLAIVKNMVTLATSGFGLVVALAWNEVIQKVVEQYIDPYLGQGSGLISLLLYSILMTVLAVFVTMQLTQFQKQLELLDERLARQKKTDSMAK